MTITSKRQGTLAIALFVVLIAIDQIIKIYIKTHFYLHESVEVTPWFYLSFIENNGMAYGMEIVNKLLLTSFRILCSGLLAWVLAKCIARRVTSTCFVVVATLVLAGAVGNIIDCVFYGRWFTDSYGHVAEWADPSAGLMPAGEWFRGKVVDMFYFPLIRFDWPQSFPASGEAMRWLGISFNWPHWAPCSNEPFMFFKPVFNFADACVSVGVVSMILFCHKDFHKVEQLFEKKK